MFLKADESYYDENDMREGRTTMLNRINVGHVNECFKNESKTRRK